MNTNLAIKTNSSRLIRARTQGQGGYGGITRLVSPSGLGQMMKPFVFLDRFEIEPTANANVERVMANSYHPHSGIMTVTTLISGEFEFEDTTGASGLLPTGAIEFMVAGNGVWHTGTPVGPQRAKGFQLWVALPPELENSEAHSDYLNRDGVPSVGPARVILGSYEGVKSSMLPSLRMNYLHVRLNDGERWTYQPPRDHNVAWIAVREGRLETDSSMLENEVTVFEEGNEEIEFFAHGKTDFVLGSAVKRQEPLVMGSHSVHTNPEALINGLTEIERIREKLNL